MLFDDKSPVRPDGNGIRRRRHDRGWAPRRLIDAIETARMNQAGLTGTITPNLLGSIEDHNERIPYETLCWIASGLDCDPIELVLEEEAGNEDA